LSFPAIGNSTRLLSFAKKPARNNGLAAIPAAQTSAILESIAKSEGFIMMHRALLCICTIAILISFSRAQSSREKQDRRINPQAPLQAELLAPVDANKLSLGAPVFAKARVDWNDPACHLRTGSAVTGHIVAIEKRTKQSKGSSLTIAFDQADCDGRIAPIQFTLFALIAAPEVDEGMPLRDSSTNFGTSSMQPHMSMGATASTAHAPTPVAAKDDMSLNGRSTDDKTPKASWPDRSSASRKSRSV
jgi:hypothetical protein